MGFEVLWILFVVSLVLCMVGFVNYVYFMSIGYGLAVAGIGVALVIMGLIGTLSVSLPIYLMLVLFVVYGFRLSGFLLIRELKNAAYKKTLNEVAGDSSKMPFFVKITIWVFCAILYVAQTAGVFYRIYNGGKVSVLLYVGIVISALAILLESAADKQKGKQKKERPDMVATKGLYKIVRCPNYLGEILFWTGVTVSSLDILEGAGQWILVIVGYICIVFVMFNGAQRLEKRQMKRYGDNAEYNEYVNKTPIIIPLIPLYHLAKQEKGDK